MSTARKRRPAPRLTGVTYDTYVKLRDAPGNRHLRMAYHDGVLEFMSPQYRHDRASRRLMTLIYAYCQAFDVPCEAAGSTTFRKGLPGELKGKGREADESFHIGAVVQIVLPKDTLDLMVDPPPSLWVEVDNWGSSASKLPLYAGLGVPEVWRFRPRRRKLWFGRLAGATYEELAVSVVLPGLTPGMVLQLLADGARTPAAQWGEWLRADWFPSHRKELIDPGTMEGGQP
jgi:Uma2 family endonuclease